MIKNIKVTYTTSIDNEVLQTFRTSCKQSNLKQNEVLEVLMKKFIEGEVGAWTSNQ